MDDLSVLFRLGRLGLALLPGSASLSTMCDICDDVMVDLLKGAEGLQSLPCSWACLKVPECVAMCTNVKEFSQNRLANSLRPSPDSNPHPDPNLEQLPLPVRRRRLLRGGHGRLGRAVTEQCEFFGHPFLNE